MVVIAVVVCVTVVILAMTVVVVAMSVVVVAVLVVVVLVVDGFGTGGSWVFGTHTLSFGTVASQ